LGLITALSVPASDAAHSAAEGPTVVDTTHAVGISTGSVWGDSVDYGDFPGILIDSGSASFSINRED
jgi:hypothetical protein